MSSLRGHPPDGWATTLQTYVFHLRRALEPGRARGVAGDVLVTRDRGYLLRVDREQLDAARFQDGLTAGRAALDAGRYAEAAGTLRGALDLWRSGVLADLAGYAFTRPEAARLEELRLAALEARVDADLALGRHDTLTGELERLAAEHPLRERLHGQLMLALYRCGRQAEALAAYRRARDLLASELGIDPAEPLRRLHASVLAHDPALDWNDRRETQTQDQHASTSIPAASPAPELPGPTPAPGSRVRGWAQRRARRLLAAGLVVAVAAAAVIVAVARPWAGGPAGLPANSVGLIDPAGGRVGAAVSVGSPAGLAYGDGSVWAVDSTQGMLSRINPATHAVIDQIPVGSAPTAVTVTGQDAWVTNSGDGTVSRINTAAGRVVDTIAVGNLPVAIASGPSGVWVADEGDDTVNRIDPATGTVTRSGVQVGARPDGIAVGPHAVWVSNSQDGTVTRIDPATGQPGGPIAVGSGPAGIAVTPEAVWVANSLDLTVSKINPATGTVTATIGVGDGPGAIVATQNAIWVSDQFNATLDRIDPRTSQVTRNVYVGSSPQGLAATPTGMWAAAQPFTAASHRGGTLTVVDPVLPATDPTQESWPTGYPAQAVVYDGLVALRRSGGAAGLTLVPDLATRLPRPAEGGRTYTFTLRPGIRYSNATLLRASDIRRGFEQQITMGVDPGYYEEILGAQACRQHPLRCDLSAGIIAIDRARILQLTHLPPGAATVTCQILPADFPGHHSYCPYTAGIKNGIWHGPDMEKAMRLVKDSRTMNVPVTIWTFTGFADTAVGSYLVRLLKELGYRASLRTVSTGRFFSEVSNFRRKIQMGLNAWGSDFPDASTFFLPVLSCRSFYRDPTNANNLAEFCDPRLDRLASQAGAAQLTDPAAARRLWAQVDRIATDEAPWVPIFNGGDTQFVSSRVGNYQESPEYGPLLDQMWVR